VIDRDEIRDKRRDEDDDPIERRPLQPIEKVIRKQDGN
jgi:hypothetical protein